MPLYNFRCDKCDYTEERITKMDVFAVTCDCGGLMKRQLSMPTIKLDGTDPGFPGAYDKWGRDRERRRRENDKRNS